MNILVFADSGSPRDERSPERSDADGGRRGRDSAGHLQEIHRLRQSVSSRQKRDSFHSLVNLLLCAH